ncbi:MAG: hypothetical protein ATN35_09465 [Epulopiscium sp. Nele67-Bin004]|nr:MAG: hypothetical protein ATN35_09465 [Epulopiscium sp. Nele67-Bin004]
MIFILQLIKFLLLAILFLIVTVIALILFLPNKYDIYVEKWEELIVELDIYILSLLRVQFFTKEKNKLKVSIFNKKLYPRPKKKSKPKEPKVAQPKPDDEPKPDMQKEQPKPKEERRPKEQPKPQEEPKPKEQPKPQEEPKAKEQPKPQEQPKPKFEPLGGLDEMELDILGISPETPLLEQIPEEPKTAREKIKSSQEEPVDDEPQGESKSKQILSTMMKSPYRNATIKKTFICLSKMVKTILPKKLRFDLEYGGDTPDKTGLFVARTSVLLPIYINYGTITGNFINKGIWGSLYMVGKFSLAQLLKLIIMLIFDKDVRKFIGEVLNVIFPKKPKKSRKLREEEEDGK